MRCPCCNADKLDYRDGHIVCTNPDCDFAEEIEPIFFYETEDYYNQKGEQYADTSKWEKRK